MCTFLSRVRNGDKPVNKETEGWWLPNAKVQTDRPEHFFGLLLPSSAK